MRIICLVKIKVYDEATERITSPLVAGLMPTGVSAEQSDEALHIARTCGIADGQLPGLLLSKVLAFSSLHCPRS